MPDDWRRDPDGRDFFGFRAVPPSAKVKALEQMKHSHALGAMILVLSVSASRVGVSNVSIVALTPFAMRSNVCVLARS